MENYQGHPQSDNRRRPPPGPEFQEPSSQEAANKLYAAAEKACALLEQLGEEIRLTHTSLDTISNLRAVLDGN